MAGGAIHITAMATERLYYEDSWRDAFEAEVVAHHDVDGRVGVELDRSLFYPESGGQMADRGVLEVGEARVAVHDVQLGGDAVLHFVDGEPPGVGASIRGHIDRARRRSHMALHTGQHILSRALVDEAGADTTSSRLGETACTIDVDRDRLDDAELARALDLANAVVDDDHAVVARFPSAEELASLSLRREAKVDGPIRVVSVGDFDDTPCGGTHCTRSGQVGLLEITGIERHKRRLRISFVAGPRARRLLGGQAAVVRALARDLSCAPDELPAAYERLREQARQARDDASASEHQLAQAIASTLPEVEGRVVAALPLAADTVRAVAQAITTAPASVALLLSEQDHHMVIARGADSSFDCGAFVRAVAQHSGARGGGRPERAEGRLPTEVDWPALVAEITAG
jgi:alanyl-tRNA synthetase